MIYVPGSGNPSAKLMVVGEAPGAEEELAKEPFVGPTGQMLNQMLKNAGINRIETYCTNVVKNRPPANKIRRLGELGKKIEDYLPQLHEEVDTIRPNVCLLLGQTALGAFTGKKGIQKYRGSILWSSSFGVKVVPSIHPAYLLHQKGEEGVQKYSAKAYIQLDIKRAAEESKTRELELPQRTIRIVKTAYALHQFFEQFGHQKRFALDIETVKGIPVLLAIAPSPFYAISIQLFNLPGFDPISKQDQVEIFLLLSKFLLDPTKEFIGQNWKFDQEKLSSILLQMVRLYADTMLLASVVNPEFPKSLAFLGSVYTREPYYKDEGKEFVLGRDPIDQFFNYNGKDACVTFESFLGLLADAKEYGLEEFYFGYVNKLHQFYFDLEQNGLLVDFQAWKELREKYLALLESKVSELHLLANYDLNANSSKQVYQYLKHDLSLPITPSTTKISDEGKDESSGGSGRDKLVMVMANHAKNERQRRSISLILEIRRIKKTISTYLSALPDFDGRMRTGYKISGTETGRSSTSILKPPARAFKGFGQPFQVFTKHGNIGADIRRMYVADKGYLIMECDESQAEARVVALLAEDYDMLKLYDTVGFDVHKMTASWIFGTESIDSKQRYIGKKIRHSGNYGEGKRRAALDINAEAWKAEIDINLSEKEAGKLLDVFHARSPRIKRVFHAQVEFALKRDNRVLISPHGRRRQFFERWGPDLFREAYATIPQAVVRDHGMQAALRIKERIKGIKFIMEAHDSFTVLVPENLVKEYAEIFKEEFEKKIDFSRCSIKRGELKIPCEFKLGENLKDLKDYHL